MKRFLKIVSILCAISVLFTFARIKPINAFDETYSQGTVSEGLTEKLKGAVVLYVGSPNAFNDNSMTRIDQASIAVTPVIKNNRTLVPVRFIAESLGADVNWDGKSMTAVVTLNNKKVSITVGSYLLQVEDEAVTLEAAAEIIGDRTFIPLRALAEALGKKVFYDRGLIVISDTDNIFDSVKEKSNIDELIAQVNNLPVLASYDKLLELLENTDAFMGISKGTLGGLFSRDTKTTENSAAAKPEAATGSAAQDSSSNPAYSETNVQVQGVDEADVVKTDGEYIYQVNKQRVVIAKAYPAAEMKLISVVDFTDKSFNPMEIYIHGNRLVVIGQSYLQVPYAKDNAQTVPADAKNAAYVMPYYSRNTVKTIVYDITDKAEVKKLREVEAEGNYVSSRKIGSALYMVSNKYANYYTIKQNPENALPAYRDTTVKEDFTAIGYNDVRYFPGMNEPNYLVITSFDLDKNDLPAGIQTYLGSGNNIYVSEKHLYVASTGYRNMSKTTSEKIASILPGEKTPVYGMNTYVYKFSLGSNKVTYLSKGEVPGNVLNQFSMDESNGYFRIATTLDNAGVDGKYTSANNLYVLDDAMNIAGKVENIAPGERIYSVRFMGDRAYMVTFKTVDPLFVISLKEPTKPEILGALKIPGYSNYLHPYDENHIIGFGKDTIEISRMDSLGNAVGTSAYYLGMKIAIFDVTDVNNPIEEFTEKIGDRGTDSPLLSNHKALLFDKSRNLLAFPISVAEVKGQTMDAYGFPQYGQTVFQGAYVYNIDTVNGFKLKGKVTHLTNEDYIKSGNNIYYGDKTIERLLYIGDSLYTLSNGMIKANEISTLKEIGSVSIP